MIDLYLYLFASMLTHALLAVAFCVSPRHLEDVLGKRMFAYAIIMAVWAAGLLLQPSIL